MRPSSHGHMSSTAGQFAFWYKLFVEEVGEVADGSTSRSYSKQTSSNRKEAVFDVESVLLHYTGVVGTYKQYGALKAHHTIAVGQAIHFWRTLANWEDVRV